jgi:hypothetical protein
MECRMWKVVGNFWCKLTCMTNERMNKKVMVWACIKGNRACRNWPYRVRNQFSQHGVGDICDIQVPVSRSLIELVFLPSMFNACVRQWRAILNRETGTSGKGVNKLITYRMFKDMFVVEEYSLGTSNGYNVTEHHRPW